MIHIIIKYSSFILILLFAISCTKPTLTGHWKCDKTGLAKALNKNDEMQTAPITEFYDLLKNHPLGFVFSEDGKAKSISTKISGTISELPLTVTNNQKKGCFQISTQR